LAGGGAIQAGGLFFRLLSLMQEPGYYDRPEQRGGRDRVHESAPETNDGDIRPMVAEHRDLSHLLLLKGNFTVTKTK
jgi:hypothetical protein